MPLTANKTSFLKILSFLAFLHFTLEKVYSPKAITLDLPRKLFTGEIKNLIFRGHQSIWSNGGYQALRVKNLYRPEKSKCTHPVSLEKRLFYPSSCLYYVISLSQRKRSEKLPRVRKKVFTLN